MNKIFLFSVFFIFISAIHAQDVKSQAQAWLRVKSDCQKKKEKVQFYHIQIYNGPDLSEAKKILQEFISLYPHAKAYIVWENPEYKVWVGEYVTRFEAEQDLKKLKENYPFALLVFPRKP
ncbi:MAG: SPOR domain-containing protein [Chlorobi bacterium]|nr:SPOR domain-containing protein [Chlorobiota bacterium]